jgi:hypothetical protein
MTLVISKGITLRKGYIGTDDPDAEAYIAAVEAADEAESPGVGALETATKVAIHSFVKGCKNDGIWPAIKASCILAGARTLTGALVPLVGTAPTNNNFVSGDYNRETGLAGNGSTKYLNSNRNNNADPQDSKHLAIYKSSNPTVGGGLIGTSIVANGTSWIFEAAPGEPASSDTYRVNSSPSILLGNSIYPDIGFIGVSRFSSATSQRRYSGVTNSDSSTSQAPDATTVDVFKAATTQYTNARLAFYSIGESLDLALLDARVTTLINAFAAAIP